MLGNSLDSFLSGTAPEGEQDRHRPSYRKKLPFPTYCYDKVFPCLLSREACCQCPLLPASVSTAKGLATLSKEGVAKHSPFPRECTGKFKGSWHWSRPAWVGLAGLSCRILAILQCLHQWIPGLGSSYRFGGYKSWNAGRTDSSDWSFLETTN